MFTKYVRTGSATATVSRYRKTTDWDMVWGVIFIGLILIAIAAG